LPCPLPVNFKQYVPPGAQSFVNTITRGAIEIAVYFGPFEHGAGISQRVEFLDADETIVPVIDLARPGRPCGARNRQHHAWLSFQQGVDETGLPGAAGSDHHEYVA